MAGSGRKRPPLVADKRYTAKPAAQKTARKPARKTPPGRRKPARTKPRRKSGRRLPAILAWPLSVVGWILKLIWRLTWRGGVVVMLIIAAAVFYVQSTLPPVNTLLDGRARGSVTLLDRHGKVYAWRGDQYGGIVTTDTVSPAVKNAVIATEDKRFYRHFGLSPRGIASAVRINLSEGRGPLSGHGGSTLTQQVAKLLCLGVPFDPTVWDSEAAYERDCRRSTLWRKIKEAIYAMALEARYSKDEILTIYLNRAFLGSGSFGFEAASQRYFGHSAAEATIPEAAMMAGMLTAPSRYAPTNNLKRSQDRAATVLKLMQEQGYITMAQREAAAAHPATLSQAARARAGGYFAPRFPDPRHDRGCDHPHHPGPEHPESRRRGAGLGVRQQGARRVESAGGNRGHVGGRGGARSGRWAGHPGHRCLQPRHPGQAPDRISLQTLRLCRSAGSGL